MKKKLLLLLFVVSFSAQGQTSVYHPFPDSGAVWNGRYFGYWFDYVESYSYIMSGDTLIGSNVFHKLMIPFVATQGSPVLGSPFHSAGYAGCIREDVANKKVFYVAPGDTAEVLLYNFNLQVGDTIPGFTRFGCQQWPQVIYGIDSILIGSDYRKRWLTDMMDYGYIIEGIGGNAGLLEGCLEHTFIDGPGFRLDCFQQNGNTLYSYTSAPCNLIDGVISITDENIFSLSPNPATNEFAIYNSQSAIKEVEVYDVVGRKQIVLPLNPLKGTSASIDVSELASGIYFVRVRTEKGSVVKKFIKQ